MILSIRRFFYQLRRTYNPEEADITYGKSEEESFERNRCIKLNTLISSTVTHETMHALGAGHSGFYSGVLGNGQVFESDHDYLTVMSYLSALPSWVVWTANEEGKEHVDEIYRPLYGPMGFRVHGPRPMDVEDMRQALGGANPNTNAGDTVYYEAGNTAEPAKYFAQEGAFVPSYTENYMTITIIDANGFDIVDLTWAQDGEINTRPGSISHYTALTEQFNPLGEFVGYMANRGSLGVASGTDLEEWRFSDSDQVITNSGKDQTFVAGGGDDTVCLLYGGGWTCSVDGGEGYDIVQITTPLDQVDVSSEGESIIATYVDSDGYANTVVMKGVEALQHVGVEGLGEYYQQVYIEDDRSIDELVPDDDPNDELIM